MSYLFTNNNVQILYEALIMLIVQIKKQYPVLLMKAGYFRKYTWK